jgi:acyl-coenzyme A thioesterase PaaI-like protein
MTGEFERASAVVRRDERHFDAEVHPGWDIGGNANGGYLLAIAGRAMAEVTGRPPLTITAHYLAPAPAGPCTVEVDPIRSGRRMATAGAALRQDGREVIRVLGTFAEQVPDADGARLVDGGPPDLPSYAECVEPARPDEGPMPAINERLAVRMRPGDDGFRHGRPTGRAEIAGWFAFVDERPVDAIGLLLVADAFAPPVFNTHLPVAWVPTLELTVHVRGVPAPGPLRCVFRSRFVQDGLVEEDGEVWDTAGHLVCQSRQLSLTPRA